eukprot:scaffold10113_cov150-Isochrysis_galbana.AAC.5
MPDDDVPPPAGPGGTSAYELQLIGVILIVFGSFSSSIGLLLMKRSSGAEVRLWDSCCQHIMRVAEGRPLPTGWPADLAQKVLAGGLLVPRRQRHHHRPDRLRTNASLAHRSVCGADHRLLGAARSVRARVGRREGCD